MMTLVLPLDSTVFDRQYGKIDLAPRVMGLGDFDGEVGYLVAYSPSDKTYLIVWDDSDQDWITETDFRIISNITLLK